jgi:hypothetical protein
LLRPDQPETSSDDGDDGTDISQRIHVASLT